MKREKKVHRMLPNGGALCRQENVCVRIPPDPLLTTTDPKKVTCGRCIARGGSKEEVEDEKDEFCEDEAEKDFRAQYQRECGKEPSAEVLSDWRGWA